MSIAHDAHEGTREIQPDSPLPEHYANEGIKLVRLDRRTRKPIDKEWPQTTIPPEEIKKHVRRGGGLGWQCGEVSGWISAVDLDWPEAMRLAPRFIPETLQAAKGGEAPSHSFYRSPGLGFHKFRGLDGSEIISLKASNNGQGHQVAVAPTVHPAKGPYHFIGGYNPATVASVDADELRKRVGMLAVASLVARHLPPTKAEGGGGRHDLALALAGYMLRNGETVADITQMLVAAWEYRKAPSEALKDVHLIVRDTAATLARDERATGGRRLGELIWRMPERIADFLDWGEPDMREQRQSFNLTDLGNSERFVAHHGEDVRYCYPWSTWLVWTGARWERDVAGRAPRLAKEAVRSIYREASEAEDEDRRKALAKHATRSEGADKIRAMIELARSEQPVTPDELDMDPMLLNAKNGTIDLRTGELREHRREDLITKMAPVEYDPNAYAPTWAATLERVLPSPALRTFFKKLCGYAISGDVSEHLLAVLYGTGANGKSTLINALLEAAGEYGMQAAPDLLIAKKGAHPTEVADLFGMRLVASIEVEDGRRLAEALVKSLTGGDKVRARRMRQDFWEFEPTHTAFLCTNHKPEIRGTDAAIWRRIRLIPFAETIPPAEQDKKLPKKLRAELSGILRWMVEGCLEWQRSGLQAPEEVRQATAGYRSEMDVIGVFLADECEVGDEYRVLFKTAYERYSEWCTEGGEKPEPARKFNALLKQRGAFEGRRSGPGGSNEWHGLKLLKKQNPDFAGKLKQPPQKSYNSSENKSTRANGKNSFSSSVASVKLPAEDVEFAPHRDPEAWEQTF